MEYIVTSTVICLFLIGLAILILKKRKFWSMPRPSEHTYCELDTNENDIKSFETCTPCRQRSNTRKSVTCEKSISSCITTPNRKIVPLSVNYHFTRQCNYKCGFCFHTSKTSFVLPLNEAKRGLEMLKEAGMEKVNFSGGEPFIVQRGNFVGELVRYCKESLHLPSVSIVSNGSLVKESWFEKYGEYLDILAISCDSFDPDINDLIGRYGGGGRSHLTSLRTVRRLCGEYKVAFKLNTVVNTHNKHEDMTEEILQLDPCRWKVFQCLLIDGENAGEDAIRNASTFVITDNEFNEFLDRHKNVPTLVPESNEKMQNSYLILDEYMRFLDCTNNSKQPSKSLLDVGVENALSASGFDERMFFKRGGKYTWSKGDMRLDW